MIHYFLFFLILPIYFTMNKKAQADVKALFVTVIVIGILAVIGILIFSTVSNSIDNILTATITPVTLESASFASGSGTLDNGNGDTVRVIDLTFFGNLTDNSSTTSQAYVINESVNFTTSGVVTTNYTGTGNFNVSYVYATDTEYMQTNDYINDTVLDSMELGVIALIILAAVTLIGALFYFGSKS